MKKGEIFEGKVLVTEFPNKGIVEIEDKKVTIKNGLEGQTLRFSISKKRRDKIEGRLLEVLEKSPLESDEASCPHFGICGGCSYQNLSYEKQLSLKKSQIERLFEKAGLDVDIETIYGSPMEKGYRNKMEFTFGDEVKDGPLALGMHKKNSFYDIVPLTDCQIVHNDFNIILQAILNYFREQGTSFYHRLRHVGYLRHLVLRRSVKTGDILVNLVTSSQGQMDEKAFVELLLEKISIEGKIVGIIHTINDSVADVVQSDEANLLYGQDYFYEYLYDMKFKISPYSFFQTNTLGAEVLYGKVREYVGETKDKLIYDLYSGTGTIAQIVAPVAKKVVGVEIVEEAVEAAKVNAGLNHLENCEFIAGDVLKVVDSLTEKPDIIILDPPRDGIHPKALPKIIKFGLDEMVYVSCKPTSLVRDLLVLREAGYEVKKCCLVDMFPGTVHVETVVLLSQQKPDDTIEIDLDLDELDATSAELKATYQEIKDYVLKEFGLKVSNLYISQVKRKCGIEVGENYNLPKSENARVPQCPKEKEDAIKAALKYFAMF